MKKIFVPLLILIVLLGVDFARERFIAYGNTHYTYGHESKNQIIIFLTGISFPSYHLFLPFPLVQNGPSMSANGGECGFLPPGPLDEAKRNYENSLSIESKIAKTW